MAAINQPLIAREVLTQLAKRDNFASRNPGVIVVFAIVFVVAVFLICLYTYKYMAKKKNASQTLE